MSTHVKMASDYADAQSMLHQNQASVTSINSMASLLKEKMQVQHIYRYQNIFTDHLYVIFAELPVDDSPQEAGHQ